MSTRSYASATPTGAQAAPQSFRATIAQLLRVRTTRTELRRRYRGWTRSSSLALVLLVFWRNWIPDCFDGALPSIRARHAKAHTVGSNLAIRQLRERASQAPSPRDRCEPELETRHHSGMRNDNVRICDLHRSGPGCEVNDDLRHVWRRLRRNEATGRNERSKNTCGDLFPARGVRLCYDARSGRR